jgi:hypothetical protein
MNNQKQRVELRRVDAMGNYGQLRVELGRGRRPGELANRVLWMVSSDNELSRRVNRSEGDFTVGEASATNLPPGATGPKCV